MEHLQELYKDYQRTGRIPNLLDLYQIILDTHEVSKKRQEYFDVIWNRMRTITGVLGRVLDCEVGVPAERLLDRHIVLELDQLRPDEQNWLVEVLLMWVYHYRLVQRHRGERLRHAIILDECHRWFYTGKEYSETTHEMGMPIVDIFPTQFRDFGEALICTTNMPSTVSQSLHSNTLIKISGNQGSGVDTNTVSEAMGLRDDEEECIHRLRRAEWICKLSDYYTEPFMIITPDYPLDSNVSDREIVERLRNVLPELYSEAKAASQGATMQTILAIPRVSEDAAALLLDVNRRPFRGIARRFAGLGLSGRRGLLAKAELLQKHVVVETDVQLGTRRPTRFLIPTDHGLRLLESMRERTNLWCYIGHVSFEHRLFTVLCSYALRSNGYRTKMEHALGQGRRLDIYATKDSHSIGVEVLLAANNDYTNLLETLGHVDRLIIVCRDNRTIIDIEGWLNKTVRPELRPSIRVILFSQLMRDLRRNIVP